VLVPVSFSGGTSEVAVDSGARDERVGQVREIEVEVEARSEGGAGRKLQPSSLCKDSNRYQEAAAYGGGPFGSRASVSASAYRTTRTVQQSNGTVEMPLNVTSLLSGMVGRCSTCTQYGIKFVNIGDHGTRHAYTQDSGGTEAGAGAQCIWDAQEGGGC